LTPFLSSFISEINSTVQFILLIYEDAELPIEHEVAINQLQVC
jgi:hypothetical protein